MFAPGLTSRSYERAAALLNDREHESKDIKSKNRGRQILKVRTRVGSQKILVIKSCKIWKRRTENFKSKSRSGESESEILSPTP